jgi:serine/threonine protein kinase
MTPERWAQIKVIVGQAMETSAAERNVFVYQACAGDEELRHEVESLLAADNGASLPNARNAIASAARSVVADQESAHRSFLASVLGQQYEILKPLGRGGMGDVYLARERALERFVAIKVLRPELALAPESRERFRREARTVAQLTHSGILRLHTFGEVGGIWYFVMGYVRGESLAERLRLERQIPWVDALRILTDLAEALEYAHQHGVVHRDIKPANILLDDESGRAILADFGIAKAAGVGDSITATGALIGTPEYMSPEQTLGSQRVDERSDIYSLGAVAYRMLAGREPFAGASLGEIMYRRVSQDAAPLLTLAPSVPDALGSIIMKCLAREPSDRWSSARDLRQALARVARGAEELPEGLRDLPTFGPYALLWAAAWFTIAFWIPRPSSERLLLLLIAFLVPIGLVLHVWNGGRHGIGPMELARASFWPPTFWGMWWPRSLRRPSDLWARLPLPARLTRSALSAFFVAIPVLIALRHWLGDSGRLSADASEQWFLASEALVVVGAAIVAGGAVTWARRQGLSPGESFRVLFGATMASSDWQTPRITRLLAPPTERVRSPSPDDPADHERAIVDVLPLLPASAGEAGTAAAAMGERLMRAIELRDIELNSLENVASEAEIDRLSAQLASLGEPAPGERSERRELRELVRHQLDIVRRVRGRRETMAQQRAHLFDLLRGLWTHVRAACDTPVDDPRQVADASNRVRTLCAEIAADLDGVDGVAGRH